MAVVRRIELLLCLWRIHGVVSTSTQAPSTSGKRALRTSKLMLLRGYLLMVSIKIKAQKTELIAYKGCTYLESPGPLAPG